MKREEVIRRDPEVLGGTPVFAGTRVPVQTLIEYLKGGDSLEDFLDGFPSVSRAQAKAFLEVGFSQSPDGRRKSGCAADSFTAPTVCNGRAGRNGATFLPFLSYLPSRINSVIAGLGTRSQFELRVNYST